MNETFYTTLDSPVGSLLLAGDGQALLRIGFPTGKTALKPGSDWLRRNGLFRESIAQLKAYFAGELQRFNLPLAPQGTPFQQQVWHALREIPYGETRSYGDIARRIGKPAASRAVGAANGLNPIPIIIPCHRVIGSSGQLVGFGGGLPTKKKLLMLEQSHIPFTLG
ncbi:MAG: methylated-DNA--[protein]-cysteine S-methyltransferase [Pseudohongiellaceae bacterium]